MRTISACNLENIIYPCILLHKYAQVLLKQEWLLKYKFLCDKTILQKVCSCTSDIRRKQGLPIKNMVYRVLSIFSTQQYMESRGKKRYNRIVTNSISYEMSQDNSSLIDTEKGLLRKVVYSEEILIEVHHILYISHQLVHIVSSFLFVN